MGERVIVGLSGGVDSSVTAYLLKQKGYDVIGITAQMEYSEQTKKAIEDAKRVADFLKIEYHVLDMTHVFRKEIKDYFVNEYLSGRTPNPCTVCNRQVKWQALLKWGSEHDIPYLATGHYAKILQLPNGRYTIGNCVTAMKDQTYVLYGLTQEQLAHTIMPLGAYSKDQVRAIAREIRIPVAEKADSQDICFIPDGDYAAFIERQAENRLPKAGNFVDKEGAVLGRHKGITHYTIGQRKGLGIALGKPVFVTQIKTESNEVVLGSNEDLFTTDFTCDHVNLMAVSSLENPCEVIAKVRYAHKGDRCVIKQLPDGRIAGHFETPVRAITSGQSVVFYQNDYVLGGGVLL